MLMAWSTKTASGELDAVHAAAKGAAHAMCGEPVDQFGAPWPFPAQEWVDAPEGRERCRYCARLVYDG